MAKPPWDAEAAIGAAANWERLAKETREAAEYEESRCKGNGLVGFRKAELYERTARGLRLYAEDGLLRCNCHENRTMKECAEIAQAGRRPN